ncbi:unnamed protein product [Soboliphyme baturini]|uniref:HP domain-containing protein n=1 Tax=Soboliphyme baturini TaxID=241478 RepID=A0A183IEX5_9BILA|nr:unnamed protein product [Soboliphyme baturini]
MSYFRKGIRYLKGGVESGFKHVGPKEYKKSLYKIKGKRNCRIQQVDCNVDSLNKGDAFVLDNGCEIFVWSGPECSRVERIKASACEFARQIRDEERQGQALVFLLTPDDEMTKKFFVELGSNENAVIKDAHFDEDDLAHEKNAEAQVKLFRISDSSGKMDIKEVVQRPLSPKLLDTKDCFILDVGPTGIYAWLGKKCTDNERKTVWEKAKVWRVENFFLMPVDKSQYGTFYSGDSYVIMYKYMDNNRERSIVYFWQGLNSSTDEKAASAMLAARMDEKEAHGDALQIRVVQNKEPLHFLKMFGDDVVILMGGHKSGFKNINDRDNYDTDGVRLFRIRDKKIMQISRWNANCNGSPDKVFSVRFTRSPTIVREGEESDAFWAFLGGKGNYATGGILSSSQILPVRLFHCTNAVGYFKVEEVYNFSQEDLIEDDVMILDAVEDVWSIIYIWIGKDSNLAERKEAIKTATEYLRRDPSCRTADSVNLLVIKEGNEPLSFTGHFPSWDPDFWKYYLDDEEFKKCFGITKEEYEKIPQWKRIPMKKKCGLY